MSLLVPNEGEILLLQYMVNKTAPDDPVIRLYTNDPSLSDTTTFAGLTQCSASGYAPITLTGANWTTTQVAGVTTAEYTQVTFTFGTAASVYGYYVTDQSSSKILWVERFSGAPFSLPSGGGTVAITPKINLD